MAGAIWPQLFEALRGAGLADIHRAAASQAEESALEYVLISQFGCVRRVQEKLLLTSCSDLILLRKRYPAR